MVAGLVDHISRNHAFLVDRKGTILVEVKKQKKKKKTKISLMVPSACNASFTGG